MATYLQTGEVVQFTTELRAWAEAEPTSDTRDLNGDVTIITALITEPGAHKVKIII